MFNIPNFQLVQPLYDSENSSVYRAIRSLDNQPVVIKLLKTDFPSTTQLARYQHEYELLSDLNLPGIIQVYSLENWQDHLILVNEIQNDEQLLKYADDIGADKAEFRLALAEVPKMSKPQFENICHSLFIFSNQLSKQAFQQLQLQRLNQLKGEELTQTRQELVHSETMASLGRLVAGFAHELNTPLGVALGSASALQREAQKIRQLMAQEEVDVDELLAAVTSVEDGFTLTLSNLERAANLVTSFKRTAVDQTSGEVRAFRVLEVIEDTINTLHNRFKPTAIKIQVTCPQELKVKSLPGALEQILTNLLMNSLIHGFEEGQRAGQIQLVVRLQETQLHLEYSDNGKGIASEHLAKVFEPFFTTHRAHGGSGLGMYICYNLVTTQLQGTLTCDSILGQGVIFRLDYPILVQI